jgi:hypothetical protein
MAGLIITTNYACPTLSAPSWASFSIWNCGSGWKNGEKYVNLACKAGRQQTMKRTDYEENRMRRKCIMKITDS